VHPTPPQTDKPAPDEPPRDVLESSSTLLPLVYEELRRLAAARMAGERAAHTLQPTALVHEAWVQLEGRGGREWQNLAHFFGAASDAMRRILIDRARRRARLKHGAGQVREDVHQIDPADLPPDDAVLLIDEAIATLEREQPEQARVVVLKFYGGLTNLEISRHLGVGERSVDRLWACAKARLFRWVRENR
jgi:RNA polymerase sigma factor (TIGR02999 family)